MADVIVIDKKGEEHKMSTANAFDMVNHVGWTVKNSNAPTEEQLAAEKEKIKGSLKQFGGSGSYEGERVYLLVKGPKLLLGAGIVGNPAGDVKGILTAETEVQKEVKAAASAEPEI